MVKHELNKMSSNSNWIAFNNTILWNVWLRLHRTVIHSFYPFISLSSFYFFVSFIGRWFDILRTHGLSNHICYRFPFIRLNVMNGVNSPISCSFNPWILITDEQKIDKNRLYIICQPLVKFRFECRTFIHVIHWYSICVQIHMFKRFRALNK